MIRAPTRFRSLQCPVRIYLPFLHISYVGCVRKKNCQQHLFSAAPAAGDSSRMHSHHFARTKKMSVTFLDAENLKPFPAMYSMTVSLVKLLIVKIGSSKESLIVKWWSIYHSILFHHLKLLFEKMTCKFEAY